MWPVEDMDSSAAGQWSLCHVIGLFSAALVTLYLALHTFQWSSDDELGGRSLRHGGEPPVEPCGDVDDPLTTPECAVPASVNNRRRVEKCNVEVAEVATLIGTNTEGVRGANRGSGRSGDNTVPEKAVKGPEVGQHPASWWSTVVLGRPFAFSSWQLFPAGARDVTVSQQPPPHNTTASEQRMHASCLESPPVALPTDQRDCEKARSTTDETVPSFVSRSPQSGRAATNNRTRSRQQRIYNKHSAGSDSVTARRGLLAGPAPDIGTPATAVSASCRNDSAPASEPSWSSVPMESDIPDGGYRDGDPQDITGGTSGDLDSLLAALRAVELWDVPSENEEQRDEVSVETAAEEVSGSACDGDDHSQWVVTSTPNSYERQCHSRLQSMLIRDNERRARMSYLDQMTAGSESGVERCFISSDEFSNYRVMKSEDLSSFLADFYHLKEKRGNKAAINKQTVVFSGQMHEINAEGREMLLEGAQTEEGHRERSTNDFLRVIPCGSPPESIDLVSASAASSPSEKKAQEVAPPSDNLENVLKAVLENVSMMNVTEDPVSCESVKTEGAEEVVTREVRAQQKGETSFPCSPSSPGGDRQPNIDEAPETKPDSRNSSPGVATVESRAHEESKPASTSAVTPERRKANTIESVAAHPDLAVGPMHISAGGMEQLAATPAGDTAATTGSVGKTKNLRFKPEPDVFDLAAESGSEEDLSRSRRSWRHTNGVTRGHVTVARPGILHHSPKYRMFSALKLAQEDAVDGDLARPPGLVERQVHPVRTTYAPSEIKMSRMGGQGMSDPYPGSPNARCFSKDDPLICVTVREIDLPSPVHEAVRDDGTRFQQINSRPPQQQIEDSPVTSPQRIRTPSPSNSPLPSAMAVEQPSLKQEKTTTRGQIRHDTAVDRLHTPSRPIPTTTMAAVASTKPYYFPRRTQRFVPDPESMERITGYQAAVTVAKPPLPPSRGPSAYRPTLGGSRNRVLSARRQYFDHKISASSQNLERGRFEEFLQKSKEARNRLATSTPDLAAMEAAVRKVHQRTTPTSHEMPMPSWDAASRVSQERQPVQSTIDDIWVTYVRQLQQDLNRRSRSMGYLETDVDALMPSPQMIPDKDARCSSLLTLESLPKALPEASRARSVDFLGEEPVENDNGMMRSEHEMRVERSLQNLTLPDWYVQSQWSRRPKQGFLLTPRSERPSGWQGVRSLNSSTCSLATDPGRSTVDSHRVSRTNWRQVGSLRSSQEHLLWSRGSTSPRADNVAFPRWDRGNDDPSLSLAVHRAFREPYLGWRATRTPSRGMSPQPDYMVRQYHTDGSITPSDDVISDPLSFSDLDIPVEHNINQLADRSVLENIMETTSPESVRRVQVNTTCCPPESPSHNIVLKNGDALEEPRKHRTKDQLPLAKRDRYSYVQSIYHSEMDIYKPHVKVQSQQELSNSSPAQVIWIESSFVGARTTTSVVVFPSNKPSNERSCHRHMEEDSDERPASR